MMSDKQKPSSEETELETILLETLRSRGKMTTKELERLIEGKGKRCPDDFVRYLSKLKFKGKLRGEVDRSRGWLWWTEN